MTFELFSNHIKFKFNKSDFAVTYIYFMTRSQVRHLLTTVRQNDGYLLVQLSTFLLFIRCIQVYLLFLRFLQPVPYGANHPKLSQGSVPRLT